MYQCNDKRHEEKGKVIIGCKSSYEPLAKIKVEEGRGFYNLSKQQKLQCAVYIWFALLY